MSPGMKECAREEILTCRWHLSSYISPYLTFTAVLVFLWIRNKTIWYVAKRREWMVVYWTAILLNFPGFASNPWAKTYTGTSTLQLFGFDKYGGSWAITIYLSFGLFVYVRTKLKPNIFSGKQWDSRWAALSASTNKIKQESNETLMFSLYLFTHAVFLDSTPFYFSSWELLPWFFWKSLHAHTHCDDVMLPVRFLYLLTPQSQIRVRELWIGESFFFIQFWKPLTNYEHNRDRQFLVGGDMKYELSGSALIYVTGAFNSILSFSTWRCLRKNVNKTHRQNGLAGNTYYCPEVIPWLETSFGYGIEANLNLVAALTNQWHANVRFYGLNPQAFADWISSTASVEADDGINSLRSHTSSVCICCIKFGRK